MHIHSPPHHDQKRPGNVFFRPSPSLCNSKSYNHRKYKALILKHKAHILKYMACIFYNMPYVFYAMFFAYIFSFSKRHLMQYHSMTDVIFIIEY